MTDEPTKIDLAAKTAEKLKNKSNKTLVDKVAEKLASKTHTPITPENLKNPEPVDFSKHRSPVKASSSTSQKQCVINLGQLRLNGFVTPEGERTQIAEEYRIIKRPLLLKAFTKNASDLHYNNLIMITSAYPNEGKSFTALNLAMSMAAEKDINVLLVDADMHLNLENQSLLSTLGVKSNTGLFDVLVDETKDLGDVLLRTNIPNLTLLPAGNMTEAPTELYASNKMERLISQLAKRYPDRIIIIDAPPVLATSEPSVLALHIGQTLFVVEAGVTSQKAIITSLGHIKACPNIHLILNKERTKSDSEAFGINYYNYQ